MKLSNLTNNIKNKGNKQPSIQETYKSFPRKQRDK